MSDKRTEERTFPSSFFFRNCMRIMFPFEALNALKVATHDFCDADRHGMCDMNDSMEMIGHEAELEDTNLGVMGVYM